MYCDIWSLLEKKSISELSHLYSIHTAEIDWVEKYWQEKKVLIWKIIEAKKHPDSDHLNIVSVDLWTSWQTQIVCGASNVIDAKYVAVATVGSILWEWFEIKQARLRWVESNWMICSEDELGFQEDRSAGIMRLEDYFYEHILSKNIWNPFFDLEINIPWNSDKNFAMKLSDIIFEIDNKFITNRPDLFSVEWNAREFGAIFDIPFTPYSWVYNFNTNNLNTEIKTDKVLAYHLVKVENVKSNISPFPIRYSLFKSWINSKFDLVDMTNYIMTELGQPMHAFDADKVQWNIVVRMAIKWEKLIAINWNEYTLDTQDIVIADSSKILAIAWIMWWLDSAVDENTKNIYIESACFDPVSVRLTAQRLALRSDSSTRYEKSIDPLLTYRALARAIDFLDFVWKDYKIIADSEYLDKTKLKNIKIEVPSDFITSKLWLEIPLNEIGRILSALGFGFELNGWIYNIEVPSWRAMKDISIKEDIVEEIWRIYWYTSVLEKPFSWNYEITKQNFTIDLKQKIQNYFSSKKYFEAYNYSFSNEALDEKILIKNHDNAIKVINAYSSDLSLMRRNLLANLLIKVQDNSKKSFNFKFFEIAKISQKNNDKFEEKLNIASITYWVSFDDFFSDLRGFFETIIPWYEIRYEQWNKLSEIPFFHPNKSWRIIINWIEVWNYWYINPQVWLNFELNDSEIIYFVADFEKILELYNWSSILYKEISKFQSIERELNFVMDEKIPVWDIIWEIIKLDKLIVDVKVIDEYRNIEKIGSSKKSITFSLLLQDLEKTISDDEAMKVQNLVINTLAKKSIELRK